MYVSKHKSLIQVHKSLEGVRKVIWDLMEKRSAWHRDATHDGHRVSFWGPSYRKGEYSWKIYHFHGDNTYSSELFDKQSADYVRCMPDSELPLYINDPHPEKQAILKGRLSGVTKQVPQREDLVLTKHKLDVRLEHAWAVKKAYMDLLIRYLESAMPSDSIDSKRMYECWIEGSRYLVKYSRGKTEVWDEHDIIPLEL